TTRAASRTAELLPPRDVLRVRIVLRELGERRARAGVVVHLLERDRGLVLRIVPEDRGGIVVRKLLERGERTLQVAEVIAQDLAELELRVVEPDREVAAYSDRDLARLEQALQSRDRALRVVHQARDPRGMPARVVAQAALRIVGVDPIVVPARRLERAELVLL